ncbi:MAG: hypothetical protein AAFR33_05720 [Pseudomonadota bacterium]
MLRLVKTADKPRPAAGLTMGGRPPERSPSAAPGLTYAQAFAQAPQVTERPALRVISGAAGS